MFCFYPNHEYACPNVSHCPHLGRAALSTLVDAASEQEEFRDMLLGQLDFEREQNAKRFKENEQLKAQVEQLKLELKVERQSKFATSASEEPEEPERGERKARKKGTDKFLTHEVKSAKIGQEHIVQPWENGNGSACAQRDDRSVRDSDLPYDQSLC